MRKLNLHFNQIDAKIIQTGSLGQTWGKELGRRGRRGPGQSNSKPIKIMNYFTSRDTRRFSLLIFLAIAHFLLGTPSARAGLTVDVHLYHDIYGYYFYPYLSANATTPNFPSGIYEIASPQIPANGSRLVYQASGGSINECYNGDCGGGTYYYTFDSMVYGITNGQWSITVTNSASTNIYLFTVTMTGVTSNGFGSPVVILFPANNSTLITNQPLFQWTGPAAWAGTLAVQDNSIDTNGNYNYVTSDYLPGNQTSWLAPVVLPNGTNSFSVDYQSNVTAQVVATQPTNQSGQPISGWISTATLDTDYPNSSIFTVGQSASPPNDFDPFLVARYNFEDTNSPGMDSSGNGNDTDCTTVSGTTNDTFSTNAAVGMYSREFFGDSSYCFYPGGTSYLNLSNALSGNFSVTAWVNTTNSESDNYANAYFGLPVFFAGADYNNHCTIPISITGGDAAFTIVSSDGPQTITLHSTTAVNDGKYHFIAVTRQQSSGLMSLYVDGNLEATGTGITNPVVTQGYISLAGGYYQYAGLLDDVRIYSTNLSGGDVAIVGANGSLALGQALGAPNLPWETSGDSSWFVETTNTVNGSTTAAQSGSVINYQTTTLTATVTGPGKLTFFWSSIASDPNGGFDYEFYIDDPYTNDIADLYGDNPWQTIQSYNGGSINNGHPINIPPGVHTLGWIVYADGDTDPTQAAFLDQVNFAPPDTTPVSANITLNIYREQDPADGDIYILFPSINSVTPPGAGATTNTVESPDGYFTAHADQGGGGESSAILFSLGQLLNECTNGLWTLDINQGLANERQFQFSVSVSGLTTNLLSAVELLAPANNATGVPANTSFQWLGPSNFTSLSVSKQYVDNSGYVSTNLPVTATFWPSPPLLPAGTNQFNVNYVSNNFPGVTFTVPMDTNDVQTVSNWVAQADLNSTATAIFVVTASPSPVSLLNPQVINTNFQFSFQTQGGSTNTIQYRTNLASGNWQTYSNVIGDGTLKTFLIPLSVFSPSPQAFINVSTH
jgi:hypothetical protein